MKGNKEFISSEESSQEKGTGMEIDEKTPEERESIEKARGEAIKFLEEQMSELEKSEQYMRETTKHESPTLQNVEADKRFMRDMAEEMKIHPDPALLLEAIKPIISRFQAIYAMKGA